MDIRCRNCHSEFSIEVGPEGNRGVANCPKCDFANILGGGAAQAVLTARCAQCGKEMAAQAGQAVPMCASCIGGEAADGAGDGWMIRKAGGSTYGPYDTETVAQWVQAGKIEISDELAPAGGAWQPVFEVSQFAAGFSPDERSAAAKEFKASKKREAAEAKKPASPARQIPWAVVGRNAAAIAAAMACIGVAWHTTQHRLFVLPEPYLEKAEALVGEQVLKRIEPQATKPDRVTSEARRVISELAGLHGVAAPATSAVLRLKGQSIAFEDTEASNAQARVWLEKAVVAGPDDPMSLAALAELYSHLMVNTGENLGEVTLRLIDRAEQLAPTNSDVQRARAAFHLATGGGPAAREMTGKALATTPLDAEAAYVEGLSYLVGKTPEPQKAIEPFERAIGLNPRHHAAHRALGETYISQQRYAKGIQAYQHKLALAPRHVPTLYALGQTYLSIGMGEKALDYFNQVLSLTRPGHIGALVNAGGLQMQLRGNPAEGRRLLAAAVEHSEFESLPFEGRKRARVQLAAANLALGNLGQAQTQVDAALTLDANDGPALYQAALIAFRRGNRSEADRLLKQAGGVETKRGNQARIRYALGMLAHLDNKPREAITELRAAIDNDKFFADAQLALVGAYLSAGQSDEALVTLGAFAKLDPRYDKRRQFVLTSYPQTLFEVSWVVPLLEKIAQERYYQAGPTAAVGIAMYHADMAVRSGQTLAKALKIQKDEASAAFYLGLLNLEANQTARALPAFLRAAQVDPQGGIYHAYLAETYTLLGQYNEATESLNRAQQYLLKSPTVELERGLLNAKLGKDDEARASFKNALAQDPDFIAARWQLFALEL